MALCVNCSSASGIPDNIVLAMTNQDSQFSDQDWVASLNASPQNDDWELKLTSQYGASLRCTLSGIAGRHNSVSVCGSLLALRDKLSKLTADS